MREAREAPEVWRKLTWVPENKKKITYIVSNLGEIRSVYPSGLQRTVGRSIKSDAAKGSKKYRFIYRDEHGRKCEIAVAAVVWMAFKGPVPEGACVVHRNGNTFDNRLENLTLMRKDSLGRTFGGRSSCAGRWRFGRKKDTRRCIAHVDAEGNVIAFYRSSREAARGYGYLNYQAILDRCNHRVTRDRWLPDGTTFVWEDDPEGFT